MTITDPAETASVAGVLLAVLAVSYVGQWIYGRVTRGKHAEARR